MLLDYASTNPNAVICYKSSQKKLGTQAVLIPSEYPK